MSRELILHIGITKTGSTSLQRVLSRARPALADQGISYPRSPGFTQHQMLAYAFADERAWRKWRNNPVWGGLQPRARIEQFLQEFDAELRALPPAIGRVILSTEYLYIRLQAADEVQRLHDLLRQYFSTMRVVVYLRRQDSHLTSLYTEILRSGTAFAPPGGPLRANPGHDMDYAALLRRWSDACGQSNIQPRIFERTAGRPYDSVQDFLDLVGIRLPDSTERGAEVNASINLAGQKLLVDLADLIRQQEGGGDNISSPVWRSLAAAVTAAAPGKGWRPTRHRAEEFYNKFRDGNEEVRRTWFPERATLFEEDFGEYPETEPVVGADAAYEAACRALLHVAQEAIERVNKGASEAVREARQGGNPARLRTVLARSEQPPSELP